MKKLNSIKLQKKRNTDSWLEITIKEIKPETIYMDAPLSLPKAYYGQGNNFHYRLADIETRAMSPMFLGGLTARAMSLKNQFEGIHFFEVYPAYFQSKIVRSNHYKKDMDKFLSDLHKKIPLPLADTPDNWHQIDALMALISGLKASKKRTFKHWRN